MKRVYLLAVLAIVVAAALGIAVAKHSGYVLISYGGFRYQSGLWAALAGAAGRGRAVVAVALPGRPGADLQRRGQPVVAAQPQPAHPRGHRAGPAGPRRRSLGSAQRHLHRAAEAERQPLLYYLGAARAANEQGRTEDSDNLLERAWSASRRPNWPLP
jgi:HemY protein